MSEQERKTSWIPMSINLDELKYDCIEAIMEKIKIKGSNQFNGHEQKFETQR